MSIFEQIIIDTHHHLWDPTSNKYDWLTAKGHEVFNNVYLVDSLDNDIGNLKVIKSVHVQAEININESIYETKWLQKISDKHNKNFPNAIIGFVDFLKSDVEEKIEKHLTFGNFRGIRQILNFDANNTEISHAKVDYLKEDQWINNFSKMQKYNLFFDLSILWTQTDDALKLINKYKNVQFIINHTLSPFNINEKSFGEWIKNIKLMSASENVAIKLSGFGEFNPAWIESSIRPLILSSIEEFGVDRCMFGTNFPVDKYLSSAKYEDYWKSYYSIVKDLSINEKDKLFYLNAEKYYKI